VRATGVAAVRAAWVSVAVTPIQRPSRTASSQVSLGQITERAHVAEHRRARRVEAPLKTPREGVDGGARDDRRRKLKPGLRV
jgi:hypothetical protein